MGFWFSVIGVVLALWILVFIIKRNTGGDSR